MNHMDSRKGVKGYEREKRSSVATNASALILLNDFADRQAPSPASLLRPLR